LDTRRWLVKDVDPDAPARLFCLPVSGMGASVFHSWPARLDDIEVCRIQLPGRENRVREPACASMAEFAETAAAALEPVLDRPFAFFGHCYGARLGYALAKALEDRGAPTPDRLFASSSLAPHRGGYFGGGRFGPYTPDTTDEEYVAEVRHACEVHGDPVPPDVLMKIVVRVLRADTQVTCGYAPDGPVGAPLPVTTIQWTEDTHVRPEDMTEWSAYGPVRHVTLTGDDHTHRSGPEELMTVILDDFPEQRGA
jgi:surfactin synthase thioesterase subunit